MKVLCCGMIRSASTWSFNACLEILRCHSSRVAGLHSESFERSLAELPRMVEHVVFKSHELDPFSLELLTAGEALAVYTHRDPLDAVVSGMSIFGFSFEQMFEQMNICVNTLRLLQAHNVGFFVAYENVRSQPEEEVTRLAVYLKQSLSSVELSQIVARTGRDSMKQIADRFDELPAERRVTAPGNWAYDRTTLLHRNHIQDSRNGKGREQLSREQQTRIFEAFGPVLAGIRPPFPSA